MPGFHWLRWLQETFGRFANRHRKPIYRSRRLRPRLEPLEDRLTPNAYTVTSNQDFAVTGGVNTATGAITGGPGNGQITLRSAVVAADAAGGSNSISLPAETYTLTIQGDDSTTTPDPTIGDLDVTSALTITGAGSASTIIDATGLNDKIFSFNPFDNTLVTSADPDGFAVSVSGVTLEHGDNMATFASFSGEGGAFDFDAGSTTGGGSLSLNDVVVDHNSTTDGDGGGIALFDGGTVNITNSKFTNNTANSNTNDTVHGGGIFVGGVIPATGTVTLTSALIDDNSVTDTGGQGGGYFSGLSGSPNSVFHADTITNNTAAADGGGIDTGGTSDVIDQGTLIDGNTATTGNGGGINAGSTALTISDATITNNHASAGKAGGVFVASGSVTMSDSRLVGNTSSSGGTAVDKNPGITFTATNNWWGTNTPPASLFGSLPVASYTPFLVMTFSAAPTTVNHNGTSTLTAAITKNSNNQTGFSVPDGTPVSFSGGGVGSVIPSSTTTTSGTATSTLTASGTSGNVSSTIDNQTLTAATTVTGLAVTPQGNVAFIEGISTNVMLATFTDATPSPASAYSVSIDWGDTTVTSGAVSLNGSTYTVTGTHAYADETPAGSPFTVVATITETGNGNDTGTATDTANVAEGDTLTATAGSISGFTEGIGDSAVLALFGDSDTANVPSDFTASIDWGDSTITAGTVSGGSGSFTVSGTHTYADDGTYNPVVTLSDDAPGTANATATSTFTVAEAAIVVTGEPVTATEGTALAGVQVATFTDSGSLDAAGAFSATIVWGDGHTSAGTVTGSGGTYTVTGSNNYADEGSFTVTTTVTETGIANGVASGSSTATVADADTLAGVFLMTGNVSEGQPISGRVATFSDGGYPGQVASDLTGTFDWGDGTTFTTGAGNATITKGMDGFFTLGVASHAYADEGSYTVTAVLADDAPGADSFTQTGTLTATEADNLTPSGTQPAITLTEGQSVSGVVATFTDTGYPNNSPSDFSATIVWGDGGTDPGMITSDGAGNFTVSGAHAYADEGTDTVTVTIIDDSPGTDSATTTNTVTVVEGDTLTATATPVTATEGVPFSNVQVATFTTTFTGQVATDFSATILWGDNTSSAGTIGGPTGGPFTVTGDHTYFDEGVFTPTVFVNDDAPGTASATASGTATVADADMLSSAAGAALSGTEGAAVSGLVATFNNTGYPSNPASDFNASIDWGDGVTSAGTVTGNGSGTYSVTGSHAYADEGTYTVTVTLADDAPGTASASATLTATIAEGDFGNLFPATITPTEGTSFSGAVASFTDLGNPLQVESDFTATIDWGDGTTTPGTVSGPTGGPFTISGTHTYADEGGFTVLASFADDAPSTLTATITSTANVGDADALTANPATITATEGSSFSGPVATFTDFGYPGNTAGDFGATIVWGDGSTDAGTVSGGSGTFTVSGTHSYADDGHYAVTVTLNDDAPGTASATAASTANIAEAANGITGTVSFAPTEGGFSGVVATFHDPGSTDPASAYSATINWGDGTITAGSVSGSAGNYAVSGSHTYADEGSQNVSVTLTENSAVPPFTATASGTVTVAEGDTLTAVPATLTGTEGQAISGAVATFTDTFAGNTAGDFSATIVWGDGATTPGTVSGGGSTFTVSGAHTYTDEGSFAVSVVLHDDAPGTAAATAASTANVAEADTLSATGLTITATEGTPFTGPVATFTDAGFTANPPTDFTATIAWGDGTSTTGVVPTGNPGGPYTISGTHTYTEDGSFSPTVVLSDDAPGTASATAASTANIAEAANGITGTVSFAPTEGGFSGAVATFSDSGSTAPASAFSATINWGDGTTTGSVSGAAGSYTVAGSHLYADEGSQNVTVTFTENTAVPPFTASASATVTVAEGDNLAAGGIGITSGHVIEGQLFGGEAAVFSDTGYPTNAPGDFTATFDWGDGTTFSTGAGNAFVTTAGDGNFTLGVAGHAYADEGTYTVKATLSDDAPGTDRFTQTGTLIADEADTPTPTATQPTLTGTEGQSVSGTIATFTDTGYPGNRPSDFSATIVWGDGSTTTGTVTGDGAGNFTVSGSHTYTEDGSYHPVVTLSDDAPGTATGTATATANLAEAANGITGTVSFAPTEGGFSGAVATFSDSGSTAPASAFSATINWGDGTTTAGSVSGAAGSYTVAGSHLYADEGTQNVTVTFTENTAVPPATASASATITVAEGDFITVVPTTITPTEGMSFSGMVGSFTDTDTQQGASDFTATIDWGDGTTTAGIVSGPIGGPFSIGGTHTYADEGTYSVLASFSDDPPSTLAEVKIDSTAVVAEADTLTATATTFAAMAGLSFGATVASFTDTGYPGNPASDFAATIDWGDGTTTAGIVSGPAGGPFNVSGNHSYAEAGSFPVTVALHDDGSGTANATATSTANVAGAANGISGTVAFAPTEGGFSGAVATFSVAGSTKPASDFSATINWGDGITDTGSVSGVAGGPYTVSGSHAYADEGAENVTVAFTDTTAVPPFTATAGAVIRVADADTLTATPATIAATEGMAFAGTVATFTDAYAGNAASDFAAAIDWGDGITTTGTVSGPTDGPYTVAGNHTYVEEGSYTVSVVLSDDAPGTASATAGSTANVADQQIVNLVTANLPATGLEGAALPAVLAIATFTDPAGAGVETAGDFTATIDWGDGTTPGLIVPLGGGTYRVDAPAHTYAEEGNYTVTVVVTHAGEPPVTGTGQSISIADQQLNGFIGPQLPASLKEGSATGTLTGIVTFTDPAGAEPVADYKATIAWGDGATDTGTVVGAGGDNFQVDAPSHTYAEEGAYTVRVSVQHDAVAAITATANVTVADQAVTGTAASISAVEGVAVPATTVLATFTDPAGAEALADYQATIDWGDGTGLTSGTITVSGGTFTVAGGHTYAEGGSYTVRVTIQHDSAPNTVVTSTATVSDPAIVLTPAGPTLPTGEDGVAYSQVINASGGTGPLSLTLSNVVNPAGLTITAVGSQVAITGTPSASGTVSFTVTPSDVGGADPSTSYTIPVIAGVVLSPLTLPQAAVAFPYSQTITASGGQGTITLAAGNFSGDTHGLSIASTGSTIAISGTPTSGGTLTFTVTPTDAIGTGQPVTYTLTVFPPNFAYDPATKTLTITGNQFTYTQATTQDGTGLLHTTFTFTMDGNSETLPDTLVSKVVVNGTGLVPTGNLYTNDTYTGTDGQTHETAEEIVLGEGGGTLFRTNAAGQTGIFMFLFNFNNVFSYAGKADTGLIVGTAGEQNTSVSMGQLAYMTSGADTYYQVLGAQYVYTLAANSYDVADHYDGSGPSALVISGTAYSFMLGTDNGQSFFNEAVGFQTTHGIAQHAGQDTAIFYDSPNDDVFEGEVDYSFMYSDDAQGNFVEFDTAKGFALVYAYSFVGGTDDAYNLDPTHVHTMGFAVTGS